MIRGRQNNVRNWEGPEFALLRNPDGSLVKASEMSDSVSFRATRMVYGDNNQPQGFEIYTYDSDQDLITVFNVDRDGMLTGSHVDDSLSISESLGITINPVNDAPVIDGFLRPLRPGNENTDYQIELSDLINNIVDVDNDEEAFNVVNLIVSDVLKVRSPQPIQITALLAGLSHPLKISTAPRAQLPNH